MAQTAAVKFAMHGARAAIADGLLHIEKQVDAIEKAVDENTGLAFDLAKTLIESTCRTILADRKIEISNDDDLPKLFKLVRNNLPFLPVTASGEAAVRKSLAQTLGGLSAAVQGVCELRNACGFASHGATSARPTLESLQAVLAAEAADAVVGFLYRVHRQDGALPPREEGVYEANVGFNDYVDELHNPVRIFDEDFMPSKILYELAPEPYRLYLAEYEQQEDSDDEGEIPAPLEPMTGEASEVEVEGTALIGNASGEDQ